MTPAFPVGRISRTSRLSRIFGATACAILLSACATTKPELAEKAPVPTMDELLAKANEASTAGRKEDAVTLWKEAATAYPADKTPWSSIAQTRYDAGQYGDAIISAQEVLVRDPNDRLANSIIAISGLRLSTRALADLSRQNNLSGSIKTESQDLARLLRESLGEQVLVPPPVQTTPPAKAVAKGKVKPKAKQAIAAGASGADPFGALK
jgi:tetratricopeptide (TPR) repeat protein